MDLILLPKSATIAVMFKTPIKSERKLLYCLVAVLVCGILAPVIEQWSRWYFLPRTDIAEAYDGSNTGSSLKPDSIRFSGFNTNRNSAEFKIRDNDGVYGVVVLSLDLTRVIEVQEDFSTATQSIFGEEPICFDNECGSFANPDEFGQNILREFNTDTELRDYFFRRTNWPTVNSGK